ncbi:methyltransferase family protein [Murinocardiopsis flavida]|uniref:Methyltransferase family protein n=1 Tax=Murinocardiopsis flavida TaxID=645275 RepID=A0A2P8DNV8_9ACTN|nr:class I SAM-dependent methyltransferase [Murinocardiopsis flavida]PSK98897.1 methyltransferase family protein [Murinocardiopsis flavida]
MHTNGQFPAANMPELFQGRGTRAYDRIARWLLRGLYTRIAEDVADVAPDNGTVLDVGTGPGVLVAEIARRRADLRITGVDLSADMVAAAQRNLGPFGARAAARVGDVTDLPFPDDSFDLIVSSFSLHHWDDPDGAVPELARVLKPGGRLAVYDFERAPFDMLVSAARSRSLLTGRPARRDLIRTGVPVFPRCARHVMTAAPA